MDHEQKERKQLNEKEGWGEGLDRKINPLKKVIQEIPIPPELHSRSLKGIRQAAEGMESNANTAGEPHEQPGAGGSEWDGIPLTQHDAAAKGSHRFIFKPRRAVLAASFLAVLLSVVIIFNPHALAGLQKVIQFIPGLGAIVEDDSFEDRYVLPKPITIMEGNLSVTITGMVVEEDMAYIMMNGNGPQPASPFQLWNDQGTAYEFQTSSATWSADEWAATYWYQGKLERPQELILEWRPQTAKIPSTIELPLQAATAVLSLEELGPTHEMNNVAITAITDTVGDQVRVSLVSQYDDDFQIRDYGSFSRIPNKQLTVTDPSGQLVELEWPMGHSSPAREFYFQPAKEHTDGIYTIFIPELRVEYWDEETVRLPLPEENEQLELNQTIELGGHPLTLTVIEKVGEDQAKLYIDTGFDESAPSSLINLRLDQLSHSAKLNEETGVVEYLHWEVDPDSRRVKVTLSRPEVVIQGPWILEVSAQ